MTFGSYLRALRQARRLKVRELAALVGVATNTLSNAESLETQVLGTKRLGLICEALALDRVDRETLTALHAAQPPSAFQVRQRERWAALRAQRGEAAEVRAGAAETEHARMRSTVLERRVDELTAALMDVLGAWLDTEGSGAACTCDLGSAYTCPLCVGMTALGIGRWDPETAGERLSKLGDERAAVPRPQPVGNPVDVVEDDFG